MLREYEWRSQGRTGPCAPSHPGPEQENGTNPEVFMENK